MVSLGLVCMVGLVGRSFWVQVAHGAGYREDGVQQRQRFSSIPAARGTIFDRDGNEMAITVPATSIYANPQSIIDPAATAHVLAQLLGIDAVSEADLAAKLADVSLEDFKSLNFQISFKNTEHGVGRTNIFQ